MFKISVDLFVLQLIPFISVFHFSRYSVRKYAGLALKVTVLLRIYNAHFLLKIVFKEFVVVVLELSII